MLRRRSGTTRRRATAVLFTSCAFGASSCELFYPIDDLPGLADAGQSPSDANPADASPPDASDAATSRYRAAVLKDSPIAYWRFGEPVGSTVAVDETHAGHDATLGTGISWGVSGALVDDTNTAIGLTAKDGMNAGTAFDFTNQSRFTLEAWIRPSTFDTGFFHVFGMENSTAPGGREAIGVWLSVENSSPTLGFERIVAGSGASVYHAAPEMNDVVYTYVVAVYDGTKIQLFYNAAAADKLADTRSSSLANVPMMIGARSPMAAGFNGDIDEAAIYGKALTQDQITAHYLAGLSR